MAAATACVRVLATVRRQHLPGEKLTTEDIILALQCRAEIRREFPELVQEIEKETTDPAAELRRRYHETHSK